MNSQTARSALAGRPGDSTTTKLRGRWLLLARITWFVVAVLTGGLLVASVPSEFARLRAVCADPTACLWVPQLTPEKVQELGELGLSVDFFAAYFVAIEVVFTLVPFAVGAIIFWRKSDEWMSILVSLTLLTFGPSLSSLFYTLSELLGLLGFLGSVLFFLSSPLLILFLYLFPDGRFVPRWTRWPAVATIALSVPTIFFPHSSLNLMHYPLLETLVAVGIASTVLYAQIYRYRRASDPVQRQQTKWVVFGIVAALGGVCAILLLDLVLPRIGVLASIAGNTAFFLFMLLIPLSIGIAILRHHLYDIDVVINRTLVYGSLTAMLALFYLGSVAALQYLLSLLTGQGNTLAIVASTLAIAALFNPLRRRIQSFIDRRFYRRKYDARKTLEAFASRLRYETDLERISEDLLEVVDETMQPSHMSLWLRFPASPSTKRLEGSSSVVRSSMQSEPPPPLPPPE